ncbi:hypothetical protein VTI74DRAFT_7053 [Chaetomium olivicolor]
MGVTQAIAAQYHGQTASIGQGNTPTSPIPLEPRLPTVASRDCAELASKMTSKKNYPQLNSFCVMQPG